MSNSKPEQITCDECGEAVLRRLVEVDGTPQPKLACECTVFNRTRGRYVPYGNDLPDRWWTE